LIGTETKVGQHRIDRRELLGVEHLPHLIEVGVNEGDRQTFEAAASKVEHSRVLIEADQPAGRANPFGDQPGVAAAADGRINNDLSRRGSQQLQHFSRQHRDVTRAGAHWGALSV
jgi:hypothetical protein